MRAVGIILILLAFNHLSDGVYAAVEDKDIYFLSTIIMIRGHLAQAIENKSNGNEELAVAHAGHPTAELFMLIRDDIRDPTLAENIADALQSLPSNVPTMSLEELKNEVDRISGLLHKVVFTQIVPYKQGNVKFWSAVMINVLEEAYDEYSEGVEVEGEVANVIEWQDAIGFTTIIVERFFPVMLKDRMDAELADVLESDLGTLIKEMKGKASPDRIRSIIDSIKERIEGSIGSLNGEQVTPDIRRISDLLDLALKSYQAGKFEEEEEGEYSEALGNYTKAKELVTKAYKEHFEPLKQYVKAVDPTLTTDTEVAFNELIKLIEDTKPVEDVKIKIEQIKENANKIIAVGVVPEFPVSVVIILTAITGIGVLLGRFKSPILQ